MARRVVTQKLSKVGTGTGQYFNLHLPATATLLKVDCCNVGEAGTDWSAELSTQPDEVGGMVGVSLLHHEIQAQANKNVTWEASAEWPIGAPLDWLVVFATTVWGAGVIAAVTVAYSVEA